jgi:hypothetical protein
MSYSQKSDPEVRIISPDSCINNINRSGLPLRGIIIKRFLSLCRKIVIHDTSPFLFSTFLNYLYSGQLETKELSVDQLADLMLLSDRYEVDSLKQACEQGLKRHIDEDSVLYFLSMGDQFNAKLLRVSVSRYF